MNKFIDENIYLVMGADYVSEKVNKIHHQNYQVEMILKSK